jgi:predicted DNA-binding transcriptional regulator YafY
MKTLAQIRKVLIEAGRAHRKVRITYIKKARFATTAEKTVRTIDPYEIAGDYIMATDNKDGPEKIKSFFITQIQDAKVLNKKFKPVWEIKL